MDKFYEFVNVEMDAGDAKERCSGMNGGQLATFKSADEARAAHEVLGKFPTSVFC